jgi:hypothetical protein
VVSTPDQALMGHHHITFAVLELAHPQHWQLNMTCEPYLKVAPFGRPESCDSVYQRVVMIKIK